MVPAHPVVSSLILVALGVGCAGARPASPKPFQLQAAPAGVRTAAVVAGSGTREQAELQARALAAFVERAVVQTTRAVVFPDYDSLAQALARGEVDVALMPPLALLRAQAAQPAVAPLTRVVRDGRSTYRSVLVAAPKSPYTDLTILSKARDLRVAWVDPSSAAGYILPKAMLLTRHIDPAGLFLDQDFLGSHDAVCRAVVEGRADVGATFSDDPGEAAVPRVTGCVQALGPQAAALTVVGATAPIPNDALTVSAQVSAKEREALVAAATALGATPEGKTTLEVAFKAEGFVPVTAADYDPVRRALEAFAAPAAPTR